MSGKRLITVTEYGGIRTCEAISKLQLLVCDVCEGEVLHRAACNLDVRLLWNLSPVIIYSNSIRFIYIEQIHNKCCLRTFYKKTLFNHTCILIDPYRSKCFCLRNFSRLHRVMDLQHSLLLDQVVSFFPCILQVLQDVCTSCVSVDVSAIYNHKSTFTPMERVNHKETCSVAS